MSKYKRTLIFVLFYSVLLVLFTTSFNKNKLNIYLIFHINEFFILLLAYFSDIVIERRNQSLEIFRFSSRKTYFKYKLIKGIKEISFLMLCIMIIHGGIVYLVTGELSLTLLVQYSFHLWCVLLILYSLILSSITKKKSLVKGYLMIILLYVMYLDMKTFDNKLFLFTNYLRPFFNVETVNPILVVQVYALYIFLAYFNYDTKWKEIEE